MCFNYRSDIAALNEKFHRQQDRAVKDVPINVGALIGALAPPRACCVSRSLFLSLRIYIYIRLHQLWKLGAAAAVLLLKTLARAQSLLAAAAEAKNQKTFHGDNFCFYFDGYEFAFISREENWLGSNKYAYGERAHKADYFQLLQRGKLSKSRDSPEKQTNKHYKKDGRVERAPAIGTRTQPV
jgi:hypothetical protein